jgi:protein Mpv17
MSIAAQTTQAALLSATSNLIAQGLSAYQEHKPFSLDLLALLKYVAFGILNTPPNALWQQFLENKFPSAPEKPHAKKSDEKSPQQANNGTRNIAIKFGLDQTVGAVMNILLFLVATNAMNGASADEITTAVKRVSGIASHWSLCIIV